uniref:Uncharacterized protein n=1 Tax=Anguilla anguilla TaxID=7936 RepID=A0A0E9REH7_ANGAN
MEQRTKSQQGTGIMCLTWHITGTSRGSCFEKG